MAIRVCIGSCSDFPDGQGVPLVAAGRRIAVFRIGERFFAIDNVCPHNRSPLADGGVQDLIVTCRTHGARFRLETGAVVRGPARKAVRTYPVHVRGEAVEVEID
ncbi:MAG: Rieske 2Fe-2S domain-containing protein [Candidatus Binatia bacterium]|nr:Rieske 2Fe-2S domain-containing protein [Candidatus Binatia bacterium]